MSFHQPTCSRCNCLDNVSSVVLFRIQQLQSCRGKSCSWDVNLHYRINSQQIERDKSLVVHVGGELPVLSAQWRLVGTPTPIGNQIEQENTRPYLVVIRCTDTVCAVHLEKRSCQLFYYCVHMARKTTPLCYVTFYVRCSVFHLGYVSLYVRCSVLDLPTGGSRVLCTCTADILLHAVQSVFGCACARNFLLWNCVLLLV